ncbi:MAG: MATE family efflux transporter [Cellulosilyticaceae bacterium]
MFSNKDLYRLIIPLILEQLLAVTVGLADSVMVASVGEAAVSGISLVDTVNVLLINIFTALATGGAVVAGQYIGQKRQEKACLAADQVIICTTSISLLITLLVYMGRNFILTVVFGELDPAVFSSANTYLLIVSLSIPFLGLYNGAAALFRAMGNSKIPMYIAILINLINVVGNAILIYGFGMGVAGTAIPTLLSRIIGAIAIIILLSNQKSLIHISRPFKLYIDKHTLKKILHIGIPNGLENSMFQLGKILILSLVASFGTASIAANAVSNTIGLFQILPGMAMGLAILTVTSQCVGAKDYDQVKFYIAKLLKITYVAMWIINLLIFILLPLIIKVYQLSPETAAITSKILTYHGICCMTIWPLSFSLPNALRASNDVKYTMIISILSMWICRIGLSYVLGLYLGWGVFGVWVAMTLDWVFRGICFVIRYLGGKWQDLKI